jgi:uncharacterized protein (TIRG00374 family)
MRSYRQLSVLTLLVIVVIWCAFHFESDWQQMSLASMNNAGRAITLAAALALVNYALRALRWSFYLSRLGHRLTLRSAAVTYVAGFAFTISPGKLGELARGRYYSQQGTPLRDLAGITLVERVMDVAAMLILAALVMFLFPAYTTALAVIAIMAVDAMASLIVVPWKTLGVRAESTKCLSRVLTPLRAVIGAINTARSLLVWHVVLIGLLLGVIAWGCEGAGLYVLSTMSADAHLSLQSATGIYAVATLAGAATFLPGGLVGTEAAMAALLVSSGIPPGDSLVITLLSRFTTLWFGVALGWIAVFFLELRLRRATACTSVTPHQ